MMLEVSLTLAYQPTQDQTKRVQNWFRQNFDSERSRTVSLVINVDKSLIAGVVIAYKGRIYDYSRAKKIEEVLGKIYNDQFTIYNEFSMN